MNTWAKKVDCVTLFVEDLVSAKSFYERVFGLTSVYEDENSAVYNFDNLMINLLETSAAVELVAPAAVAAREAGSRFQFTISVDDVDAVCAELAELGVPLLNGPMDRPWGIRTASFLDPGGHVWEIAH
ncbi:MAG TPA: VOC family protein [Acidimicrobiales bacterium]|nr:VOC family protein [Acidimicrobiales bacterium]